MECGQLGKAVEWITLGSHNGGESIAAGKEIKRE